MVYIYRKSGSVIKCIFFTPIFSGSKRKYTLMSEDYITLKFSLLNPINFKIGDYISDARFGCFELVDIYKPTYNSKTGAYDYDIRFDAQYYKWKNKICKYAPEVGGQETIWNLTATLDVHLDIFLKNLTSLGYNEYGESKDEYYFSIDTTVENSAKLVSYDSTNLIDVLNILAETWECEWWVIDNCINFGKCERETDIVFERGVNIEDISSNSSNSKYGTKLYAFGSDKNLPVNYRKVDSEIVVNGVVQRRLMLPSEVPYIVIEDGLNNEEYVEIVKIFDDVYPKTDGVISSVDFYEGSVQDEETGEVTIERFYLFTDDNFNFSKEYILEGKELRIKFESGLLNGMEFGVTFHTENEANNRFGIDKQTWEIVANEDYGIKLPNNTLYPNVGDKYILLNWDSTKIAELGLVDKAENELLEKAQEYIKKTSIDPNTYTCKMFTSSAKELYIEDNIQSLYNVGDAVKLVDSVFFKDGFRMSRIIGFEYNLDIPYNTPIYTVGENVAYSRLGDIESKLNALIYKGETYKGTSGSSIYVISRYDKTPANDYNVYSALRTDRDFFNKNKDEKINGKPTFNNGFKSLLTAEIANATIEQYISSLKFANGLTGEGYRLWIDESGLANLELDKLTVRQIMTVFELIISRIRAVGGQIVVSAANGKIKTVEDTGEAYRITFEGDNYFVAHDLIRCRVFTGITNEDTGITSPVRGYWVEVLSVDGNSILVQKSEFEEYGTEPLAGDECVLMGNTENELRQNLISISATEDGQPRIDIMDGVKSKIFTGCLRTRLGNLDGITDNCFPADNQPQGDGLYSDNAFLRGKFVLSDGKDVETQFNIQEGLLRSSIQTAQGDYTAWRSVVYNPSFTEGLTGWQTGNIANFHLLNDLPVYAGNAVLYSSVKTVSESVFEETRFCLSLKNSKIKQINDYFLKTEDIDEDKNIAVAFSLKYKAVSSAMIIVMLENCDDVSVNACCGVWTGNNIAVNGNISVVTSWGEEIEFETIDTAVNAGDVIMVTKGYRLINCTQGVDVKYVGFALPDVLGVTLGEGVNLLAAEKLAVKDDYAEFAVSGSWNGSGDLSIAYCGEINIYAVRLYSEPTEVRYATLFEQTDKLLRLAAKNFNTDGSVNSESEILVKPDGVGIVTRDEEGNTAAIGTYEDGVVKLTGKEIKLEGEVTANGNVTIDEEGRITAKDGTFSGTIEAGKGVIGSFTIDEGLEYTDENDEYYHARLDSERFSIGLKDGYSGLQSKWKKFDVYGRTDDNAETVMRLSRWTTTNSNNINEYSPLCEIVDESSYPTVVLSTRGGLLHEGAFLHRYSLLTLTSAGSANTLALTSNTHWVVRNSHTAALYVYLPKLADVLALLGLSAADDKSFAIPMSVTLLAGSKNIYLSFQTTDDMSESELNFVDYNGNGNYGTTMTAGDTWEFLLMNEPASRGYYAQITNHNT